MTRATKRHPPLTQTREIEHSEQVDEDEPRRSGGAVLSISVTYRKVSFGSRTPASTVDTMRRDLSWGTYVEQLSAAEELCGAGARDRWTRLEPELVDLEDGWPPSQFMLRIPDDNFDIESEGIDHLIGTIAGDVVLSNQFTSIEVDDITFEGDAYTSVFPGPSLGVDAVYDDLLKTTLGGVPRPILAFSVKPRRGLTLDDLEALYREAAAGGVDIVEDDERLIDPPECRFEDRVKLLGELQTSNHSLYSPNITGDIERALIRLDACIKAGIRVVKIDVLVSGFEVLRRIASEVQRKGLSIAITVYPDAYGAFRQLSRRFILKAARLCGADIIYAGSPVWSRYEAPIESDLRDALEPIHLRHEFLAASLPESPYVKSTLATITNDQHPSRAELLTAAFRKYKGHYRYGFFVGGGIAAFPGSIREGVEVWKRCLEHAATTDIDSYEPFDFESYDAKLTALGWKPMDVRAVFE
jgi:ribulose 1,5-bisphosphate carboxylase large subunit-like protein